MMCARGDVLLIVLFLAKSIALPTSQQQHFYVGGWLTSGAAPMMTKWTPVLQTYLTQEVGPLYDPPIDFTLVPFDFETDNSPDAMIAAGQLDFAYTNGGGLACLEVQYGYTTIATQVSISAGREISAYGTVLFSLKSNTAIQNITDFRGKRLGVGHPWSAATFQLGAEYLQSIGLNIYTEFSQVVFYLSDNAGLMNDIILGHIDVGMLQKTEMETLVQSGYLESSYPQNVALMLYHNVINTTYQGVAYPFPTTTEIVPNSGLAASPNITVELQQQVADALNRLNKTQPVAKAASIRNFVLPASYQGLRFILEKIGILYMTPQGEKRANIFSGIENFIVCPAGYVRELPAALENGCKQVGLTCPGTYQCFCQPCHPDIAVTIYPWQTVFGLCCALFATGLAFSVGWTLLLHSGTLVVRLLTRAHKISSAAYKGGVGHGSAAYSKMARAGADAMDFSTDKA